MTALEPSWTLPTGELRSCTRCRRPLSESEARRSNGSYYKMHAACREEARASKIARAVANEASWVPAAPLAEGDSSIVERFRASLAPAAVDPASCGAVAERTTVDAGVAGTMDTALDGIMAEMAGTSLEAASDVTAIDRGRGYQQSLEDPSFTGGTGAMPDACMAQPTPAQRNARAALGEDRSSVCSDNDILILDPEVLSAASEGAAAAPIPDTGTALYLYVFIPEDRPAESEVLVSDSLAPAHSPMKLLATVYGTAHLAWAIQRRLNPAMAPWEALRVMAAAMEQDAAVAWVGRVVDRGLL